MKPELLEGKCPMLGCENSNLWNIAITGRKVQHVDLNGNIKGISDEVIYQCSECKNLYTSYE